MNIRKEENPSILLIYTGGTIGMIKNPETGTLEAFNFQHLLEHVPELQDVKLSLIHISEPTRP